MHQQPSGFRKVKVNVVRDNPFPEQIDLAKEIAPVKDVTAGGTEASEPDWREKYLRLAADLDNTKKRLARSYALEVERQKEELLSDILEVADNLERALDHADSHPARLMEGVESIQRQILKTLERYEVYPFDAEGQPFNPTRHEAISVIHRPDLPTNTVAAVTQRGYRIGDKILRPAWVVVADSG